MIGRLISHYCVTAKLGAGGVGEGYRAHDERLEAAGSISEKISAWKCSVKGQPVYTHESEGPKN